METVTILHILAVIPAAISLIPTLDNRYKLLFAVFTPLILGYVWFETGFPPFINGRTSTLFFGSILFLRSFLNLNDKTAFYARLASVLMISGGLFIPAGTEKVDAVLISFWLGIHVPFFFLGYLSLTIAFISTFMSDEKVENKEAMLALIFLFLGLFTGAIWAEISWGKFFGFDPKEVWTLSLILTLSGYFFSDKKANRKTILRISFFLMMMTYLVVSFILPGMHSYV